MDATDGTQAPKRKRSYATGLPRGRPPTNGVLCVNNSTGRAEWFVPQHGGPPARALPGPSARQAGCSTHQAHAAPAPPAATQHTALGDEDMFSDEGLPIRESSDGHGDVPDYHALPPPSVQSPSLGPSPTWAYIAALQHGLGLQQQPPRPYIGSDEAEHVYCFPDWVDGQLTLRRFIYPGLRLLDTPVGARLVHWCSCAPRQVLRKSVFQGVLSVACSEGELQADECVHVVALKVRVLVRAGGMRTHTCIHACLFAQVWACALAAGGWVGQWR